MKILAVIPARAGSKGLPGKNTMDLGGKPLIAWTIEAALASSRITRTIVSSEGEEILSVAREWGAETPFVRPMELAQDETPGIDVVLHACNELQGFDYVVLLQPTSPLRNTEDIDAAIDLCMERNAPVCVSVTQTDKSPYWMYCLDDSQHLTPVLPIENLPTRRQLLPQAYALNGAVYVAKIDWLIESRSFLTPETIAYLMPRERSVDIDTAMDFKIARALIA